MVTIILQEGKHSKCQGLSSKTDDTKFFWLVQPSSKHKREMKHFGKPSAFWFRVGDMSQPWRLGAMETSRQDWEQRSILWATDFTVRVPRVLKGFPPWGIAVWESQKCIDRCLSILYSVTRRESLCEHSSGLFSGTCLVSLLLLSLLLGKGDEKQWNNW